MVTLDKSLITTQTLELETATIFFQRKLLCWIHPKFLALDANHFLFLFLWNQILSQKPTLLICFESDRVLNSVPFESNERNIGTTQKETRKWIRINSSRLRIFVFINFVLFYLLLPPDCKSSHTCFVRLFFAGQFCVGGSLLRWPSDEFLELQNLITFFTVSHSLLLPASVRH